MYESIPTAIIPIDWSYRANRFELGSRADPASWLEEPYNVSDVLAVVSDRCVITGCLLIDLMMLIDPYHSMIVRLALPATTASEISIARLLQLSTLSFIAFYRFYRFLQWFSNSVRG